MDESGGASLPKRGRRTVYGSKTTHIRLTINVFHQWNSQKDQMSYANKTHSEFAEVLLQKSMERPAAMTEISTEVHVSLTGTVHLYFYTQDWN